MSLVPLVGHWPVVEARRVLPFRYTVHWGEPGERPSVEIHADPNPFPRLRLWRWWP